MPHPTRIAAVLRALATSAVVAASLPSSALAKDDGVAAAVETIEAYARESFEQDQRESAIRALGEIGGAGAAEALLPLMDDPYVHIRDHAEQAWAAMLAGGRALETREWALEHGLADRRAHARAALWRALARTGDTALAAPLRRHARTEKDGGALRALAEAALALAPDEALAGAFAPRFAHRDGAAVHALAQAAGHHAGPAALPALAKLLRSRDPLARAGAVHALQGLDALTPEQVTQIVADPTAAPRMALAQTLHLRTAVLPWPGAGEDVLDALLAADDWRVRSAAVQAALRLWDARIVAPLVARLAVEEGRSKDDVQRALETFTGHVTDADADLWRAWWSARGDDFDPGARPALDGAGRVPFATASSHAAAGGTASFFDVPLHSKRILFLFDLSGSLGSAARDGEDAPSKIDLLREEIRATLESLADDVSFDLCAYRYWSGYPPRTEMTRAFGRLRPVGRRNVALAADWLADQEPRGWGAFVEPLEECFTEDVDTAVLLSDGRPTRGRYEKDFRILAEFPALNRYHALAVNTVLIGAKGADEKFMRRLASLTGGRFSERR